MMTELSTALRAAVAFFLFSCATTVPQQKSTGTNWLACNTDDDCAVVQGARCNTEHVCIDATGKAVPKTAVPIVIFDAGPDTLTNATLDEQVGCPPEWSTLTDGQGYPTVCTQQGLICTYSEGQAEC